MVALGLICAIAAAGPAAAGPGGAYATDPAAIRGVSCVAGCAGLDAARPGSVLRVRGARMEHVTRIVFLGGGGHADNATTRVARATPRSVDVVVPRTASTGRLRAVNGDGARSEPSRATVAVERGDGSGPLDARVIGRRVFYDAARQARIDLMARQAMDVTVGLVRAADGVTVATWPLGLVAAGVARTVTWDGSLAGVPQPPGRYEFRVFGTPPGAQAAQAGVPAVTGAFDLVDHRFPVRGRHHFGASEALFGAGRSGHVHQGQDVLAACGTPLVAARGGVVKLNQTQSRAGHYLIIDGEGTGVDYAYMHLRAPSPLRKGARVRTGQVIGAVGDTGAASACHLHFEMWSGPGWYTGGEPVDPLPFLKAWDAFS